MNYDYVRALQSENNNLKDRIRYLEDLLTSSKESNRDLHEKIICAEEEIEVYCAIRAT